MIKAADQLHTRRARRVGRIIHAVGPIGGIGYPHTLVGHHPAQGHRLIVGGGRRGHDILHDQVSVRLQRDQNRRRRRQNIGGRVGSLIDRARRIAR